MPSKRGAPKRKPPRRMSALVTAKKALSLVKRSAPELKFIDTSYSNTGVTGLGPVSTLNAITRGDNNDERDGDSVKCMSVRVNGFIDNSNAGRAIVRIMLVLDKQPNGSVAAVTDIFKAPVSTGPINMDNKKRFSIIYDRNYYLEGYNATAPARSSQLFQFYKKLGKNGVSSRYYDTAGTVSSNAIYLIYVTNLAAGNINVTGNARLRFYP